MKKKNLSIEVLTVKSFITELDKSVHHQIKGGSFNSCVPGCVTYICEADDTENCTNTCTIKYSIELRCDNDTSQEGCVGGGTQQNTVMNCSDVC